MKLKTEDKVIIGTSVVAAGLSLAYFLSSVKGISPSREALIYLTMNTSEGGTTIPTSGVYEYHSTGKVVLTATPLSGYVFNGWYNLGKLLSMELTYAYNLTESVVLSASFVKEGEPILIPSYITPFNKTKAVLVHNWRLYKKAFYDILGLFEGDRIYIESKDYEVDTLQFKLCDRNGNGVPNQIIVIYTDNMPDATLYGSLRIGQNRMTIEEHVLSYPLYLTTDANGIVEIVCGYFWFEHHTGIESNHDYISTLGRAGKLKWNTGGFGSGWSAPIWDQEFSPKYWYIPPFPMPPIPVPIASGWDEWQLLLDPVYRTVNSVHAYWVDNPNLLSMGVGSADCNIKMMSSTTSIPTS